MKLKLLVILLICAMMLNGCGITKYDTPNNNNPQNTLIPEPDLSTEEGIKAYLIGEWNYSNEYTNTLNCKMTVDKDLKVMFSFMEGESGESRGDYEGTLKLDRVYAKSNEVPDIISVELMDTDHPGGDFYFLHRTSYDDKFVMSWFVANNGNGLFDLLGTEDSEGAPNEIAFEKLVGKAAQPEIQKSSEFYAVFWEKGEDKKSIWIDEVIWPTPKDNDFAVLHPDKMTAYTNESARSGCYSILESEISEILGDDLFPGEIYFVKTDENGNIIEFIDAYQNSFVPDGLDWNVNDEIEIAVFDIMDNDVPGFVEYLNMGMTILFTGEVFSINGSDCYLVILGTNSDDSFVQEIVYGVNIQTSEVYLYDVLTDVWDPLT